jgi:hypothetical protein
VSKAERNVKPKLRVLPGHHIQFDVNLPTCKSHDDGSVKRFQHTAIDNATRIRVSKIYASHNQETGIKFIDHVIERSPAWIHSVRTNNGREFQVAATGMWKIWRSAMFLSNLVLLALTAKLKDRIRLMTWSSISC